MNARRIVLIVLIVLFLILIFQNTQPVEIKLLFISFSMSRALLYPLLLLLGAIVGWIGRLIYAKKTRPENKK